jgi:hypothetical protein
MELNKWFCRRQNVAQNYGLLIANKSFENIAESLCLGTAATNQI